MGIKNYVRQVRPVQEAHVNHLYRIQSFLKEGKLTPSEVVKRDSRIDLFIKKLKASDPFELVDGNTVVLKHSQELEDAIKIADTDKMKSIGLTTHDGKSLSWGKLSKSTEFGGGTAGSGGGASGTKTAESGQCVYLQAIWNNSKTNFNDGDLSSAYSQVYVDETLDKILDLTDEWKVSSKLIAQTLHKALGKRKYTFHRGSDRFVKNVIESSFKKAGDPFFPDINKWNPADIWIVDESSLGKYDFDSVKGLPYLNELLLMAYQARDIIGVSLKKTKSVKLTSMNYRKPLSEPKFTKVTYGKRDYFKSKDVYIFGAGGLEVQFRTFPAFQGEIIGKSAKHGKISGDGGPTGPIGIVMKQVGADPIPARKEVTTMIRREKDKFFDLFYNEYIRSGGKVKKEEFIKNYDKKDTGYIESKYIGTLMLNNLKGREQKFLSLAFAYAKSSVKGKSCVHLKAY